MSRKLIPGVFWGRNLAAFNDILEGGFGTPDEGFVLIWRSSQLSRARLGHAEEARLLRRHLERCHPDHRHQLSRDLDAACRGEGRTVFDRLVEIIHDHADVELRLE